MDHEENIGALGSRIGTHVYIGEPRENHDQKCINDTHMHYGILQLIL